MTTIQSVELMVGIIFLVLGLSYVICTHTWANWIERMNMAPKLASLAIGSINLVGGTFILGFHWVWHGPQTIITALGALMTVKGSTHLLAPCWLEAKLNLVGKDIKPILRVAGLVLAILAMIVLYNLALQSGIEDFLKRPFLASAAVKE